MMCFFFILSVADINYKIGKILEFMLALAHFPIWNQNLGQAYTQVGELLQNKSMKYSAGKSLVFSPSLHLYFLMDFYKKLC